jgi:hypothetical protein
MPFGGFLPADLRHLKIICWDKISTQVKETEIGPRIFLGPGKFLVASKCGSKGKTLPVDCEPMEEPTNPKFCRVLHTINIGPRNFIQPNWSTG